MLRLALGFVPGTYDVRVERHERKGARDETLVMARTIGGAQYEVSDDETKPLSDRYIEMLRKQYASVTIRCHLKPLVEGFHCITSEGEADSFGVLLGGVRKHE
jgi:hypothetical protein